MHVRVLFNLSKVSYLVFLFYVKNNTVVALLQYTATPPRTSLVFFKFLFIYEHGMVRFSWWWPKTVPCVNVLLIVIRRNGKWVLAVRRVTWCRFPCWQARDHMYGTVTILSTRLLPFSFSFALQGMFELIFGKITLSLKELIYI